MPIRTSLAGRQLSTRLFTEWNILRYGIPCLPQTNRLPHKAAKPTSDSTSPQSQETSSSRHLKLKRTRFFRTAIIPHSSQSTDHWPPTPQLISATRPPPLSDKQCHIITGLGFQTADWFCCTSRTCRMFWIQYILFFLAQEQREIWTYDRTNVVPQVSNDVCFTLFLVLAFDPV